MIVSRSLFLRKMFQQMRTLPNNPSTFQVRNSGGWSYRVAPPPSSKSAIIGAELISGFAIWWILWHLWHESGHITGEWPIVEPSEWTDAELGIPPDSEGPAQRLETNNYKWD